jgi:hypothetical protein
VCNTQGRQTEEEEEERKYTHAKAMNDWLEKSEPSTKYQKNVSYETGM